MSGQEISFTTHHLERITKCEEHIDELSDKVSDLSQIKETLVKLEQIQAQMVKDNESRENERKETAKTMIKLTTSVEQTSKAVTKLNDKLDLTDKKLDGVIADRSEIKENNKNKYIFWAAIIGSLLTSATAIVVALL